jgi:hypothetical protein
VADEPGTSDNERIARLEERMTLVHLLLTEIRIEQKQMAETIARANGGFRVVLLLGGLAGMAGTARAVSAWLSSWLQQQSISHS